MAANMIGFWRAAGVPAFSVQDFAGAARAMWDMGGWAGEEPASAFLQSSTGDVTFGRWLPEQAPEAQPEVSAQAPASTAAHAVGACTPAANSEQAQPQPSNETPAQAGRARDSGAEAAQSVAAVLQRASQHAQQQQQAVDAALGQPLGNGQAPANTQVANGNAADVVAAIASALSNQERDSADHLASGSASTGSLSSIVVKSYFTTPPSALLRVVQLIPDAQCVQNF